MSGMRVWANRAGATPGDFMVVFSVLVLGAALIYPVLQDRAFDRMMDETYEHVGVVHAALSDYVAEHGDWPETAELGVVPPEIANALSGTAGFAFPQYALRWERWELVDEPEQPIFEGPSILPEEDLEADSIGPEPVPPTFHRIGGVSVHSSEQAILAGLLDRFGPENSFVRDTAWTFVLSTRATIPGAPIAQPISAAQRRRNQR